MSRGTVRIGAEQPAEGGQDLRLMLRAASMYHLEGATQAEIARRLGVSRATAGRLIARARTRGLVRVVFDVPAHLATSLRTDVEEEVERRFGLDEVVLVDDDLGDSATNAPASALASLGRAAAEALTRRLRPDDVLGFTWGPETIAVADAVTGRSASCRRVVQLDGSMSRVHYRTGVDHVFGQLVDKLGAEQVRLPAPLYADAATVVALRADSLLSQAMQIGDSADVMVFGCGPVDTDTTLFRGAYISEADLEDLAGLGAVGEVAGRFYDAHGRDVDSPLAARTVGVDLDRIRHCPTTVLASGGTAKYAAVLGAVRGGLANVLVTDAGCAQWLLEQPQLPEEEERA
ncbi:sugar-binding transcriptional regulator [Nocardioides terrisoli]|uniref:sugar-binding transcriptional regulator n=1 Tax=Nocardioides terrisoli TaxID=3388267 RepID=UPI00287B93B2|nr:sugar-binding domain-containing protein [Nocardioides marmorisolisilvae]